MSDYYQQEVTKYMMRRAKRRAVEPFDDEPITPVEDKPNGGGWLVRLRSLSLGSATTRQIRTVSGQQSPRPAR